MTTTTPRHPQAHTAQAEIYFRPVHEDDLEHVLRVQAECYPPSMQESGEVVRARIAAAGSTSWVAVAEEEIVGYLFAYPSLLGKAAVLDAPFTVAAQADTLYLHDLAISSRAAGMGLGRRLARLAEHVACAMPLRHSALIAVQGSVPFWEKQGFRRYPEPDAELEQVLRGYPGEACYMFRSHALPR